MKNKCLCIFAVAIMLLCANGLTALAYEPQDNSVDSAEITETWKSKSKLSNKEKEELKAKRKEISNKWDSLSKEQKEEIYKLHDKVLAARTEMLDKLAGFGLIDNKEANEIKAAMDKHSAEIREKGSFPGFMLKRDK